MPCKEEEAHRANTKCKHSQVVAGTARQGASISVKWEVTPKTVGYSQQLVFHPLSSQEFGSLYDNRL